MTRKRRRFSLVGAALGVLALSVALVLGALKESIVFFNSPTDVVEKHIEPGTRIRVGGLVKEGSVWRGDGLAIRFEVTDGKRTIPVAYQGLLPDLFREGQGVVAEGTLDSTRTFQADTVLAKHDEAYMPKDVADALKKQGHWKDDYDSSGRTGLGAAGPDVPRTERRSSIDHFTGFSAMRQTANPDKSY
jgi:cytochrome c-type biogenesis protein CcmE